LGNADSEHFETYRDQTKLKHELLTNYLPVYFNILKANQKNLVFIDGFAGRGYYVDAGTRFAGSPILAMRLLADSPALCAQVQCIFVEANATYAANLREEVRAQQAAAPLAKPAAVQHQPFQDFMADLREHLASSTKGLAPTFLFVDPCGVAGVKMSDLAAVLARDYCELFLFFNYEGINRIAGNAAKSGSSPTLVDLFGSQARVNALIDALRASKSTLAREEILVQHFSDALRAESRADFLLPFRIEHEAKEKTSHYLLHATKHSLGFRLMKTVMSKAARARGGASGLEALQASTHAGGFLYEHPDVAAMKASILAELRTGPKRVSLFRQEWVERSTDMFCDDDYKRSLLELEASSKLIVLDKALRPKPAAMRMRNGQATLGPDCHVALPT